MALDLPLDVRIRAQEGDTDDEEREDDDTYDGGDDSGDEPTHGDTAVLPRPTLGDLTAAFDTEDYGRDAQQYSEYAEGQERSENPKDAEDQRNYGRGVAFVA